MSCQRYITETKIFTSDNQTDSNCNSLTFVNTGSDNVIVDNVLLQPNQTFSIDGNRDEMCVKVYNFNFVTTSNPSLTVIFKRYVK